MNATPDTRNPSHGAAPASGPGWSIAWGVLLILVGVLAVLMPEVAALATVVTFGWLLLLGGLFELVDAIQARRHKGFGWRVFSGVLTLALGLVILLVPFAGAASLALLVGAILFAGGIVRLLLAFQLRPLRGWGWVMSDGVVSILVAILIVIGWPQSSLPFIGLLTGFWLIAAGSWRILLARFASRAAVPR